MKGGHAQGRPPAAIGAGDFDLKTFDSDNVEIAYVDEGAGEPVLLIHGFASNVQVNWIEPGWVRFLTSNGFRAIAFDNRGHGLSQKLYRPEDYSAPVMAEDARRLLDHLGIPRAHVIGYSMGARIAAFLALAHPDRVRTCVFGGLGYNMVRGMAGTGPIAHALEAQSIDQVTNPTARTFRAFAEQTKSDLRALAACIRASRDPITAADLGQLACPTLVVVGSDDVVGGSAQGLADLIPNGEALEIAGRDHMKTVGDRRFKEGTLAFLQRHA
jgi:pimeloyl-ACP methyl ester carboxylesterase